MNEGIFQPGQTNPPQSARAQTAAAQPAPGQNARAQTTRLIPLACIRCMAPIPAAADEVAWVCAQCGQGMILDEARGLAPLDVFFSKAIPAGKKGRPFWVTRGRVTITDRLTFKGDEGRAARDFWAAAQLFFIPAWDASLDETIQMGIYLLHHPQRMEPGPAAPFLPVTTGPGDLKALGEFMVMSIEADRRDALRTVLFTLDMEPPQLWVLD